jgi:hypothetical protein
MDGDDLAPRGRRPADAAHLSGPDVTALIAENRGAIPVYCKVLTGERYLRRPPANMGIVPKLVDEGRSVAWFPDSGEVYAPVGRLDEAGDGSVWLRLEDVGDVEGRRWPLAQFGRAVRHLGVFNATCLVARALPTEPWLNDWLARRRSGANPGSEDVAAVAGLGQQAAVQRLFGAAFGSRAAQVLRDQAHEVRLLTGLPQTLCHHESSLANLIAVLSTRRTAGPCRRRRPTGSGSG